MNEYAAKFEDFSTRCDIDETASFTISQFVNGLRIDIKRRVLLQPYDSADDAYHKALEIEKYLQTSPTRHTQFTKPTSDTSTVFSRPNASSVTPLSKAQDNAYSFRSSANQIGCHNCHAKGHIASFYLKRTLILELHDEDIDDETNDKEIVTIVPIEDPGYENYSPEYKEDDEIRYASHVSVMRCILSTPTPKEPWKRTTIFHTFVPLNDDTCKLGIDGGSTMNVVSRAAVTRFNLKPEPHPHPSKVAWVD
ncbi:hypothetical protein TorRG33x02_355030 [Trema orientale]|uniref:Retrotransposon gag domain-containing protein n=1 Tax=Trema orientale TaxID=63057 RepID=A0A2P5AA00_TREOI|nr:hypothetical protein TorRG33x02_355030 [Trema orientale]